MPWGSLKTLSIRGFKSIESLDAFALRSLNVLIGANGSGKSNFIDFFRLLRAMSNRGLQSFVNEQGSDGLFFLGPKRTLRAKCSHFAQWLAKLEQLGASGVASTQPTETP